MFARKGKCFAVLFALVAGLLLLCSCAASDGVGSGWAPPYCDPEGFSQENGRMAYTRDGETGDAYIERIVDEIGKNETVRVVTSDNLIRLSALRSGVLRTSSGEFMKEVEWVLQQIDQVLKRSNLDAHKTKVRDGKQ
jgi:hypothetical protein